MSTKNLKEFIDSKKPPPVVQNILDMLKNSIKTKQNNVAVQAPNRTIKDFTKKGATVDAPPKPESLPMPEIVPGKVDTPSQVPQTIPRQVPQTIPRQVPEPSYPITKPSEPSPLSVPNSPNNTTDLVTTSSKPVSQNQTIPNTDIINKTATSTSTSASPEDKTKRRWKFNKTKQEPQQHNEPLKLGTAAVLRGDTANIIDPKNRQYKQSSYSNINRIRTQNSRELSTIPTFITQSYSYENDMQSRPHEIGTDEIVQAYKQVTPGEEHNRKIKRFRAYYEEKCNPK